MYKELIKKYASNITPEQIIEYSQKEGTEVTDYEANLFVDIIKTRLDEMLNGNAVEVLNEYKDKISEKSYDKLLELYDKYKKFIN